MSLQYSDYNGVILNNITILWMVVSLGVAATTEVAKGREEQEKEESFAKVTKLKRRGAVRMKGGTRRFSEPLRRNTEMYHGWRHGGTGEQQQVDWHEGGRDVDDRLAVFSWRSSWTTNRTWVRTCRLCTDSNSVVIRQELLVESRRSRVWLKTAIYGDRDHSNNVSA